VELDEFVDRLTGVRQLPSGVSARCPAHDDNVSSLMVNKGRNGGLVVKCHAGCTTPAVLSALDLGMKDLMGDPVHVATYSYVDGDGATRYEVRRFANPKTFRCVPGLPPPAERILYQLPAIRWAREHGAVIYVVEGEKDVDRLVSMGLVATTCVTGAGSWLPHYAQEFEGCSVIVIADNDEVGRAHGRAVFASIETYAVTVALVIPHHGKDVSELLDGGYSLADGLAPLAMEEHMVRPIMAAQVREQAIRWLWPGYIPAGKLSIVEGDPGDGKSILTIDLTARWTSGAPMPDGGPAIPPGPVVMVSAEDDEGDTIKPRLIAAGANLEMVALITSGAREDLPFEFATDLPAVERLIRELGAVAVIFDPLSAFLSERTDSHNDASIRRALQPLRILGRVTGAGVLVVRHLNKGSGVRAIYRGGGSIGITGAARSTLMVVADPDDDRGRVLASVKNNLAPRPLSLRYSIDTDSMGRPYVAWKGTTDQTVQDILDTQSGRNGIQAEKQEEERRVRAEEKDFLMDVLRDGPMTWKEIATLGRSDGFPEHNLRRARADLGLVKITGSDGNRTVTWASPGAEARLPIYSPETGPSTSAPETLVNGQTAEDEENANDLRNSMLDDAELICDICQTNTLVNKHYGPYWKVRCTAHDPRKYHG
jgi:putative DNA primase/helicase